MQLDRTLLENALAQLKKSLDYCRSDLIKDDPDIAPVLRAAAIQAFEYSYDISFKMLRRYLKEFEGSPEVVMQLPYRDVIRMGAETGFIDNPEAWFMYRECRNITSHAYSEEKAAEVFDAIPGFYADALALLNYFQQYDHAR